MLRKIGKLLRSLWMFSLALGWVVLGWRKELPPWAGEYEDWTSLLLLLGGAFFCIGVARKEPEPE